LSNSSKSERIHALDSLRAIMMMLGLVLHTAITYGVINYSGSWPLKDFNATSPVMDWLVGFIHIFRMPLFFIVAGFFGALLFYKRGAKRMARNRMARILYPFLVFILILWPMVQSGFGFSRAVFDGDPDALQVALNPFLEIDGFIPKGTMHLWFLYYLFLITLASFVLGLLIRRLPVVSKSIFRLFNPLFRYPFLKLLVFSSLTFILLMVMGRSWVATSLSFTPDLRTFVFYSYFYLFGWILFTSRQPLEQLKRFDWLFTILGTVLFTLKFIYVDELRFEIETALNALLVWMLSLGITGLFIRYASNHSHSMRYVSDSSYWFYLIHLPLTAFIPGLVGHLSLGPLGKFLLVLAIVILICWFTYHYLVRATFIGKFLNGRRYPRKKVVKSLDFRQQQGINAE